jgi:hypothetical protein
MKDITVFNTCVTTIEKSGISAKEIQTVLRLLAAKFPKPKKVVKPAVAAAVLPPHYRTLKKKD